MGYRKRILPLITPAHGGQTPSRMPNSSCAVHGPVSCNVSFSREPARSRSLLRVRERERVRVCLCRTLWGSDSLTNAKFILNDPRCRRHVFPEPMRIAVPPFPLFPRDGYYAPDPYGGISWLGFPPQLLRDRDGTEMAGHTRNPDVVQGRPEEICALHQRRTRQG